MAGIHGEATCRWVGEEDRRPTSPEFVGGCVLYYILASEEERAAMASAGSQREHGGARLHPLGAGGRACAAAASAVPGSTVFLKPLTDGAIWKEGDTWATVTGEYYWKEADGWSTAVLVLQRYVLCILFVVFA
jgi:hypothetical protein